MPMNIIYGPDSEKFPTGSITNQVVVKVCSLDNYFYAPERAFSPDSVFSCITDFPYIALHRECLELSQRLCYYRQSQGLEGASSLGEFYEIYRDRFQAQGMELGWWNSCFLRVIEPHTYYMRPDRSLPLWHSSRPMAHREACFKTLRAQPLSESSHHKSNPFIFATTSQ